jgi:hypothetical protein
MVAVGSLLAFTLAAGYTPAYARLRAPSAGEDAVVELRGRVVCLGEGATGESCAGGPHRFALETPGGGRYAFRSADPLAAMFVDDRVRERELVVRARKDPAGELETIKVYSVRNGRLFDLDYFCEVCNIVAYAPGPCVCCGRPMALRETPLH